MKNKLIIIGAVLLLLITAIFLVGCQGGTTTTSNTVSQQQGIWVNGEGKVTVVPDLATVQLGVEAQSETVADAQSKAAGAMDGVMNSLKNNGIAQKDIQTRYFNIQKVTRWDNDKQQEITIGYRVTNLVTVKIREVAKAGQVIDAATAVGGDFIRVDSITFSVDDPIRYYDLARQKAVADAQDKAKSLAELAGVKLGKPVYISESGGNIPTPGPIYSSSGIAGKDAATSISAGELEVILNVQVVYAIR